MNDNNINLDNVLENLSNNNLPFVLLLLVLVIIVLVIIISDYFLFRKKENFDTASNDELNNDNLDNNLDSNLDSNSDSNLDVDLSGYFNNILDNDNNNNIFDNIDTIDNDNNDNNDNNFGLDDDYKKYYDQYKDKYDEYKKEYEKLDKTKEKTEQTINKYKTDISNYKDNLQSKLTNQLNAIKSKIGKDLKLSIPIIKDTKVANSIIIVSFILIILILSFMFLPNFKDFSKLFSQISNITYLILYTIFTILFFRLFPSNIMKKHAFYIVPITIIFACILFGIGFQTNYVSNYNLNYERIKMIIMCFCFITLCITYYTNNPGNYITNNFNTSLILSIIIGILCFIYLLILLTLPITNDILKDPSATTSSTNILKNVSSFSKYGSILFILFIVTMSLLIVYYPGGFFKSKTAPFVVIPLLLIICIIWSTLLITNMFSDENTNSYDSILNSRVSIIKKAILTILGFSISAVIIAYFVISMQKLSGKNGITSFILSLFLIISILTLIYKTFFVQFPNNNINKKKNGFFELIINFIFYIPCLFSNILDAVKGGNIILLLMVIAMIYVYFNFSKIKAFIFEHAAKKIITKPTNLDKLQTISNYIDLNGSDNPDYQYSLCFSLFIDSNAPNTNASYNKYTSVLNYGGKPNILYKASTTTLMITMDQKDLEEKTTNNLLEFDENGNRIIYMNKDFLLQKWNNFVLNFNGGTLDVFLNGELVKSCNEVVPYKKLDSLTIGSDFGIKGAISDVMYYKTPLSLSNIYYISK
jgi:hypothetical protein